MAKLRLSPIPEVAIRHYRETGDWTYDTLCDWLFAWTERAPETPAIDYAGSRINYRELSDRVRSLAGGLQALGISRGDVVALPCFRILRRREQWALKPVKAASAPMCTSRQRNCAACSRL